MVLPVILTIPQMQAIENAFIDRGYFVTKLRCSLALVARGGKVVAKVVTDAPPHMGKKYDELLYLLVEASISKALINKNDFLRLIEHPPTIQERNNS